MAFLSRSLELLIALYLISHIFITVLYDSQAVLPKEWFSEGLLKTTEEYIEKYHDPLMTPPLKPWFESFILVELFVQFPYFFAGAYAFVARRNWIRIPSIVYSVCVLTTMLPIIAELLAHDDPAFARNEVLAIYSPFVVFPVLILLKTVGTATPFGPDRARHEKLP